MSLSVPYGASQQDLFYPATPLDSFPTEWPACDADLCVWMALPAYCDQYPDYGAICFGNALVPLGEISKRISHSLGTLRPSISGGENSQRRTALNPRSAKYLLGPGESSSAFETFPAASTCARTPTRTRPRIVARAFSETSGKTWSSTSPRSGETLDEFGVFADANVSVRNAATVGAAVAAGTDFSEDLFPGTIFPAVGVADFACGCASAAADRGADFGSEAGDA